MTLKKTLLAPAAILFVLASCSKELPDDFIPEDNETKTEAAKEAPESEPFIRGEAIVKLSDELLSLVEDDLNQGKVATRSMGLNQALDELGIKSIHRLFPDAGQFEPRTRKEGLHKWYVVEYSPEVAPTRAAAELEGVSGIELVERRRKLRADTFNDPQLGTQWGYINGSTPGADINVEFVWNFLTTGSPNVVVEVVDGGIDPDHPDLKDNLYDQNFNFVDQSPVIYAHSHGTHVAGTIAAVNNNEIGVCGIAGGDAAAGKPGVKLMSCQIFKTVTQNGETTTKTGSGSSAIKWGADHGAVISQNSWGYDYDYNGDGRLSGEELEDALNGTISQSDKAAVDYFIKYAGCDNDGNQLPDSPMKGGVVIFSAGNESIRNGVPANYEPIIAVGAIASNGSRATYSNYGPFVDICAPGTNIKSTMPGNVEYGNMSGTSMACPHVSGVAALLVSYFGGQGFTNEMLWQRLIGGSSNAVVDGMLAIGGLVDALGSITYGDEEAPASVADLSGSSNSNFISLDWTVPQDSKGIPAYGFKILYGVDKEAVEASTPGDIKPGVGSGDIVPMVAAGGKASFTVSGLDFSTDYYVKVFAYTYAPVYSEDSGVITVRTAVNNPPVIATSYSGPREIKAHETLSIPITVTDPDGHSFKLSYGSGSAADSFDESESTLTIVGTAAEPGTYTASFSAEDEFGAKGEFNFVYTILQNHAPQTLKEIGNMLIGTTGSEFNLNLNDYFTDQDGETLRFEQVLSDPSVAFLSIQGSNVIGTALKYGLTTATITATDAKGEKAEITFKILVRDASVKYTAYPNPVTTNLYLATGETPSSTAVKIVSSTGGTVYDGSLTASAFDPASIDMSSCAPGRYSMTIQFGGESYTQTIVKK